MVADSEATAEWMVMDVVAVEEEVVEMVVTMVVKVVAVEEEVVTLVVV